MEVIVHYVLLTSIRILIVSACLLIMRMVKHRMQVKKPPCIIVFVGNIGAGKSTYMSLLNKWLRTTQPNAARFFPEPVTDWKESLVMFYDEPKRYAFMFQMYTLLSRFLLLNNALKLPIKWAIFERCLQTDKLIFADPLYKNGSMNLVEYNIYTKWHAALTDITPPLTDILYVYLRTSPEVCLQRIASRSRDGEEKITLEYLEQCHKAHEAMMDDLPKKMIIDANGAVDIAFISKCFHH